MLPHPTYFYKKLSSPPCVKKNVPQNTEKHLYILQTHWIFTSTIKTNFFSNFDERPSVVYKKHFIWTSSSTCTVT